MASECVEIVNWLKNWFKPKDEDYSYEIYTSDYNPTIDSNITIVVEVTDGNGDPVPNHSFKLRIGDFTEITLTTDNAGAADYTYACTDWGIVRFSAGTKSIFIRVSGWRTISLTHGKLYVNGEERLCELHYTNSMTFPNQNTYLWIETVSEIASYPPKSVNNNTAEIYVSCSAEPVRARIFPTGSIQALSRISGNYSITFSVMWHY